MGTKQEERKHEGKDGGGGGGEEMRMEKTQGPKRKR